MISNISSLSQASATGPSVGVIRRVIDMVAKGKKRAAANVNVTVVDARLQPRAPSAIDRVDH